MRDLAALKYGRPRSSDLCQQAVSPTRSRLRSVRSVFGPPDEMTCNSALRLFDAFVCISRAADLMYGIVFPR